MEPYFFPNFFLFKPKVTSTLSALRSAHSGVCICTNPKECDYEKIKIMSTSKSKINLADCRPASPAGRLRTEDSRNTLRFAYCLLPTCIAGRQAAYLPYLLMTVMFLLTFTIELLPTIRYVSHTGSSAPPYTSWDTAADSIQKAIDICEPGDTVLVANGLYNEAIYINKTINLWGSSMDSTIIDGRNTSGGFNAILYFYENNSSLKNFHIISPGYNRVGIVTWRANIIAENCRITDVYIALAVNSSSVKISNFIISIKYQAISDECPFNNCISIYTNNILISQITGSLDPPVLFIYGGRPTFTNNILIGLTNSSRRGIYSHTSGTVIKNNLIAGFLTNGLNITRLNVPGNDSVYNNVLSDLPKHRNYKWN
jgi:hypothetical protein